MSTQDAQEELDRLAGCLARAFGSRFTAKLMPYTAADNDECYAVAYDGDRNIETGISATHAAAVADLRAILRADTDGAIADVLDTLAVEAERGPITAEMLRTMAATRRGL